MGQRDRKWELDDEHAYCETCAAIGSVFLSHKLSRAATDPFRAELVEWDLFAAARYHRLGVPAGPSRMRVWLRVGGE